MFPKIYSTYNNNNNNNNNANKSLTFPKRFWAYSNAYYNLLGLSNCRVCTCVISYLWMLLLCCVFLILLFSFILWRWNFYFILYLTFFLSFSVIYRSFPNSKIFIYRSFPYSMFYLSVIYFFLFSLYFLEFFIFRLFSLLFSWLSFFQFSHSPYFLPSIITFFAFSSFLYPTNNTFPFFLPSYSSYSPL